jgi:hypothetical protein
MIKPMNRTLKNWLTGVTAGVVFFGATLFAFAQNGQPLTLINPLGNVNSVNDLVKNIGAFMLALAVPICGIMVIVGAFQMMTAAGDPAKFSKGRMTLFYAAIGFIVVLFATSVVPVLKSILGG